MKLFASFIALFFLPISAFASEVTGIVATEVGSSGVGGVVIAPAAFSPIGATYSSTRSVTISASGASRIYYTTNGATPSCGTGLSYTGAAGTQYSGSVSVSSSRTLKAIACYAHSGSVYPSAISSASYTINVSSGGGGGGGSSSSSGSSSNTDTPPAPPTTPVVTPTANPTPNNNAAVIASVIAQLRVLVDQLVQAGGTVSPTVQNFLNSFSGNTNTSPATTPSSGVRDLEYGMEGTDVRALQNVLMNLGYSIPSGATGRFLEETQVALTAYQRANSIAPAVGYFGPTTRAQMKAAGLAGLWW